MERPITSMTSTQIGYSSLPYQDEEFKRQLKDFQVFITPKTTTKTDKTSIDIPRNTTGDDNSNSILDGTTHDLLTPQPKTSQTKEALHETLKTTTKTTAATTATTTSAKAKKSRVLSRSSVPKLPNVHVVKSLDEFQDTMERNKDQLIVVRFHATWCKACRAIAPLFQQLARKNPSTTFIELPVMSETVSLHKQLKVKAIPSCHIYHPLSPSLSSSSLSSSADESDGLGCSPRPLFGKRPVEELRMDRKSWSLLEKVMKWYVDGSCDVSDFNGGDNDGNDDDGYLEVEL